MKQYNRNDYQTNEDGEYKTLPAGGYVAQITSATDDPNKEYLKLEFEITEGEYEGFCAETYQRARFWPLRGVRSYSEKARAFFNGFISSVEQSNPGFTWTWDEKALLKKAVGIVVGEREYVSNSNEKRDGIEVAQIRSVQAIREGRFKVPEKKLLSAADKEKLGGKEAVASMYTADSEEPPF